MAYAFFKELRKDCLEKALGTACADENEVEGIVPEGGEIGAPEIEAVRKDAAEEGVRNGVDGGLVVEAGGQGKD